MSETDGDAGIIEFRREEILRRRQIKRDVEARNYGGEAGKSGATSREIIVKRPKVMGDLDAWRWDHAPAEAAQQWL